MDSSELSGVRRSNRERKVPQRRFCGTFATYSEMEANCFNRLLPPTGNITGLNSTRTSIRKIDTGKKNKKESKKEPVIKKGKKKKGQHHIREEEPETSQPVTTEGNASDMPIANEERIITSKVHSDGDESKTKKVKYSTRASTRKTNTGKKKQIESEKEPVSKKSRKVQHHNGEEESETLYLEIVDEIEPDMPITNAERIITTEGHTDGEKSNTKRGIEHHITGDITSTTDNISNRDLPLSPKRNKITDKSKNYQSPVINSKKNSRSLRNKPDKNMVSSTSHHSSVPSEKHQNSINENIADHIPEKCLTNSIITDTNYGISQNNMNSFPTELAIEQNEDTTDFAFHISLTKEIEISREDHTQGNKLLDKDSGRSTMLRSATSEDSNLRSSKLLTGRINKKYKKRDDNICNKIAKVLSRSINNSRELEILNGNERDMIDSDSALQTPFTQPIDSEYINLLSNKDIITMKYVDKMPNYRELNDNIMVTDLLKNSKDGGAMGYLKIPLGGQKPLHIARKFALFYFVIEGEAFIQVHNKTSKLGRLGNFMVPLGVEYFIKNVSKTDSLTLGFVKVPSIVES